MYSWTKHLHNSYWKLTNMFIPVIYPLSNPYLSCTSCLLKQMLAAKELQVHPITMYTLQGRSIRIVFSRLCVPHQSVQQSCNNVCGLWSSDCAETNNTSYVICGGVDEPICPFREQLSTFNPYTINQYLWNGDWADNYHRIDCWYSNCAHL